METTTPTATAEREAIESVPKGLFVAGQWRPTEATMPVEDPSTGEVLCEVADASPAEAMPALDAAAAAQADWARTTPRERSEILSRAFELMIAETERLALIMTLEMGKPLAESRGEVAYAAEFLRWFAEEAVRIDGGYMTAPGGGSRFLVTKQPVGVSLMITPWNFPLAMGTRKIGPAIAAGCTSVIKPAAQTPLCTLAFAELLTRAGLPDGVVNVVTTGQADQVMSPLILDPRSRKLSFTGSTGVGKHLLELCAKTVMRTSMELGGNAPFLVFEDADIDAAVDGAMVAKMRNGGQSCIAANRFLVHEAVADSFAEKFAARMRAVKVGPGMDPGVDLGPLINESAQEDMAESVELATGAGGDVLAGGKAPDRPGFFFEPTVLAGVPADAEVLGREIFGPVAPIVTFGSEEEAVAMANDTIHGLAAYLYTGDLSRGLRVAEALESGMVGVNRGLISDPAAPFGGVKQSGIGREGGHEGMKEFLEIKYIAASW